MEQRRSLNPSFIWVLIVVIVSQNLVIIPVMSRNFEDQKHYYSSPSPHTGDPHKSPPHGTSPSPSHGSGGSCNPTPSTPSPPSTGGGGGGGYYHSPPSSGSGGGTPSTPTVAPITPTIPSISSPPPPLMLDPNTPLGGTCNFWRTHPALIWSLLGWWGTVGGVFGVLATPATGTSLSLPQALANTRSDGIGALYREGTASFLNSMVNKKFPFTTKEVKDSFVRAVASNKAAAAQAELFKQANEGRLKRKT
ncbi:protodermal factor 1 isoform X2 [Telopea speciosissima]|uniref:protodermal factor 1 isoform X2 n=1 Tax=Telopea speciosissima TaxID=54955 RepID=UPI001CC4CD30|nr:protodermal factor 1 isoform X2 [Telopea speciosissima]